MFHNTMCILAYEAERDSTFLLTPCFLCVLCGKDWFILSNPWIPLS